VAQRLIAFADASGLHGNGAGGKPLVPQPIASEAGPETM
jgi:hypothetical protein